MYTTDIFKRFAVFANKQGVLKHFADEENTDADYIELKAWAEALPENGRLSIIDDFIFGQNVDEIEGKIKNCAGYFMLVEYGPQQTPAPDPERKRVNEQPISIIIGKVAHRNNWDLMVETVENNRIEKIIFNMGNMLAADDREVPPFKRLMDKAIVIAPVEPTLLYDTVGWQIAFKVQSYKFA